MTNQTTAEVRRQVIVPASVESAFAVFTERFGDFKPAEHHLLAVPFARTCFEPHVGGYLYDVGVDGSECRWARILAYEPPTRVVFSWDIGPTWQLEPNPDNTSEVEVTFVGEGSDRTRVELVHRHIDRHGPGWDVIADGVSGAEGWPLYLDRYAALFAPGT